MSDGVSIRRITQDDWQPYRRLRLEALADAPRAFRDRVAEALARPNAYWQGIFEAPRAFFGAFRDDDMVGQVNFLPEQGEVVAHKGWLLGMFVASRARRTGTGRRLIERLIEHAGENGCTQVHLGVGAFNTAAIRLYERMGFSQYGTEPRGQIVDGEVIDEHLMVRFLDK